MGTPLTIIAVTTAAPGQQSALRKAQEKLVAETVKERGCLRYELHQSIEDGRKLVFIESWATEEDWRTHMQGAAIKRFHASGANNLIQDFSLFRMNIVAGGPAAACRPPGSGAAGSACRRSLFHPAFWKTRTARSPETEGKAAIYAGTSTSRTCMVTGMP